MGPGLSLVLVVDEIDGADGQAAFPVQLPHAVHYPNWLLHVSVSFLPPSQLIATVQPSFATLVLL